MPARRWELMGLSAEGLKLRGGPPLLEGEIVLVAEVVAPGRDESAAEIRGMYDTGMAVLRAASSAMNSLMEVHHLAKERGEEEVARFALERAQVALALGQEAT